MHRHLWLEALDFLSVLRIRKGNPSDMTLDMRSGRLEHACLRLESEMLLICWGRLWRSLEHRSFVAGHLVSPELLHLVHVELAHW